MPITHEEDLARRRVAKHKKKAEDPVIYAAIQRDSVNKSTWKKFGLTPYQVEQLKDYGCCICGSHKKLSVDHDHTSGNARGILCHKCNIWMAAIDAPGWLEKALRYKNAN